jgi:hypothetical protein
MYGIACQVLEVESCQVSAEWDLVSSREKSQCLSCEGCHYERMRVRLGKNAENFIHVVHMQLLYNSNYNPLPLPFCCPFRK